MAIIANHALRNLIMSAVASSIISIFVGGISVAWWTSSWRTSTELSIAQIKAEHVSLDKQVSQLDVTGSRSIPILQADIKRIDNEISKIQLNAERVAQIQANLTIIQNDINRMLDRQNRLTQALDNTYDLLQEHLRTGAAPLTPPLHLPKPKFD